VLGLADAIIVDYGKEPRPILAEFKVITGAATSRRCSAAVERTAIRLSLIQIQDYNNPRI
jgi:hypothetical protein